MNHNGTIVRIAGPIVDACGMGGAQAYELVWVGHLRLMGEVIRVSGDIATIQVYEDTTGVAPGEPVACSGQPLSVELGPGLLGGLFDGLQRPLETIRKEHGFTLPRAVSPPPLDETARWHFVPKLREGDAVEPGVIFGCVQETHPVEHRLMAPQGVSGVVASIAAEGDYTVRDTVLTVRTAGGREIHCDMTQRWPVRTPRPARARRPIGNPLITGLRVIDTFFPVGKGGAACVAGGFGTGKTMTQHSLAKWSDADIVVYIGCGERGNEMTDVLRSFYELEDPRSGRPLMERTVLIANTSNMPVAAREVSIYTGIALAEYYRDMGYDVAVMADSTSRWAEALRELSGRLEEMPAEEGFPAYLATRLAQFYERAGCVETLGGRQGSVTVVGAASPPGGDFSEPVTRHTRRFVRCFWTLDSGLANSRHYPAIHWLSSYSEYIGDVAPWWNAVDEGWAALRGGALGLLQREDRLQKIVKLVGPDALPDAQRLTLFTTDLIKNAFLSQNGFDVNDRYSSPAKQLGLLRIVLRLHRRAKAIIAKGVPLYRIRTLGVIEEIGRAKLAIANDEPEKLAELASRLDAELDRLEASAR